MAFTYDPSTDRGRVRLYLRDQDEARYAFADAEIDAFITVGGTWQRAVAEGAKALLADRARFGRSYSRSSPEGESVTEDETAGLEYLQGLIERWGGGASTLPLVTVTHMGRHASDPADY